MAKKQTKRKAAKRVRDRHPASEVPASRAVASPHHQPADLIELTFELGRVRSKRLWVPGPIRELQERLRKLPASASGPHLIVVASLLLFSRIRVPRTLGECEQADWFGHLSELLIAYRFCDLEIYAGCQLRGHVRVMKLAHRALRAHRTLWLELVSPSGSDPRSRLQRESGVPDPRRLDCEGPSPALAEVLLRLLPTQVPKLFAPLRAELLIAAEEAAPPTRHEFRKWVAAASAPAMSPHGGVPQRALSEKAIKFLDVLCKHPGKRFRVTELSYQALQREMNKRDYEALDQLVGRELENGLTVRSNRKGAKPRCWWVE